MHHLAVLRARKRRADLAAARGIALALVLGAGAQLALAWALYTAWQFVR